LSNDTGSEEPSRLMTDIRIVLFILARFVLDYFYDTLFSSRDVNMFCKTYYFFLRLVY